MGYAVRLGQSVCVLFIPILLLPYCLGRSVCVRSCLIIFSRMRFQMSVDMDGARWNLAQEEVERRRRLFWQLFIYDTWIVSTSLVLIRRSVL
jgi:Fungal specific transcription factor domain